MAASDDEVVILHFVQEQGEGEYIVIQTDPDEDPEDHKAVGYKLYGKHVADIHNASSLPTDRDLVPRRF